MRHRKRKSQGTGTLSDCILSSSLHGLIFADALGITDPDELNAFYDLAGISKNGQHSDINGYMESVPSARVALRAAKDHNFTNKDWEELIRIIKQKNG